MHIYLETCPFFVHWNLLLCKGAQDRIVSASLKEWILKRGFKEEDGIVLHDTDREFSS